MLTPRDMLQVQFRHAFRGYSTAEVDSFIRRLLGEYETLRQENARLKGSVTAPEADVAKAPVQDSAEQLLERARREAEAIVAAAREEAAREEERLLDIRQDTAQFSSRMRGLIGEYLSLLQEAEEETAKLVEAVADTRETAAAAGESASGE